MTVAFVFSENIFASLIDTATDWNSSHGTIPFGEGYDATYGQTFIAEGDDIYLDSWTFFLQEASVNSTDFAFYIMDWDTDTRRATGSILYQSAMVTTSNNGGAGGYEAFTFNTDGLALESGNNYVGFISASSFFNASLNAAAFGTTYTDDTYANGSFLLLDNDESTDAWTSSEWTVSTINDAAFIASFSNIPEPSSLSLVAIGALAGVIIRKKMKR